MIQAGRANSRGSLFRHLAPGPGLGRQVSVLTHNLLATPTAAPLPPSQTTLTCSDQRSVETRSRLERFSPQFVPMKQNGFVLCGGGALGRVVLRLVFRNVPGELLVLLRDHLRPADDTYFLSLSGFLSFLSLFFFIFFYVSFLVFLSLFLSPRLA